ncbi:MAG TPA: efflux RND transporter periplasmic adaptor subunit [Gammaproteobacteria bacterium]|nr:efflux RND transporter periplasmic adaptor subunit [Gammaproteobacteria bacterium]
MNNKALIVTFVIAVTAGAGGGYWFASNMNKEDLDVAVTDGERKPIYYRNPMNPTITSPVPTKDSMGMDYIPVYADEEKPKEKKVLFYRNPMNPSITSPVPAKDSMGMDYIPVYADDEESDEPAGTVKIDPVTVQNIGVRTAVAKQRTLSRHIRAVGRIAYNEEKLSRIHPKTEGWIEKLRVDKTGSLVKKDDILLSIYAPQLVSSQEEYLLALKNQQVLADSPFEDIRQGAIDLVKTSRERLELLDMAEHQIRELEKTKKIKKYLHIHSPFNGIVMKVGVREGQYVTPKTQLYMLADLSRVWVFANIYEYELPWVKVGDPVEMTLAGIPGKTFKGKLSYIYPYAEAKTRTIKVRLEFPNEDLLLKPDMFAEVTIHASRQIDAVVVPSESIVRSGTREQIFIVRGPGKFEPRDVKVGVSSDGATQIIEGVKAGEEVVSSALFLIDSESKLREATAKMLETTKSDTRPVGSQHSPDRDMNNADMDTRDQGEVRNHD